MTRSRCLAVFVTALLLSACGKPESTRSEQYLESVAENGHQSLPLYKVATDGTYPPFESESENHSIIGFDVDILTAAANAGGFKVEFINTPWEGIFATLGTGERDIVASSVTITEPRKQTMDFSVPYFEARQVMVVPSTVRINQLGQLSGKKIGVQTGTTGEDLVQHQFGRTATHIVRFENTSLALNELQKGGLDAVIADNGVAIHYINSNPARRLKVVNDLSFHKEYYGFAVKSGNLDVLHHVNEGLIKIKANGTYNKIYARYFGAPN